MKRHSLVPTCAPNSFMPASVTSSGWMSSPPSSGKLEEEVAFKEPCTEHASPQLPGGQSELKPRSPPRRPLPQRGPQPLGHPSLQTSQGHPAPRTGVTTSGAMPQGWPGSMESPRATQPAASSAQAPPANLGWTIFPPPAPGALPGEAPEPGDLPAARADPTALLKSNDLGMRPKLSLPLELGVGEEAA